jgi:hypothetical protein
LRYVTIDVPVKTVNKLQWSITLWMLQSTKNNPNELIKQRYECILRQKITISSIYFEFGSKTNAFVHLFLFNIQVVRDT